MKVDIYTDGACKGNPGRGGWAAILMDENGEKQVLHGSDPRTTNNKMELMGAIKGLEAAPDGAQVTIYSDSQYLVNTMTKGWKRNKNQDLWKKLDDLCSGPRVRWRWVPGHAGDPGNEEADYWASLEASMSKAS
jgi:ribonuclease HI